MLPRRATAATGRDSYTGVDERFSWMITTFTLLVIIALILTVLALAWPKPFVLPVAVLLLAIALLIGGR